MIKFTLKFVLAISLFCSVALADGVMGAGDFAPGVMTNGDLVNCGVMGAGDLVADDQESCGMDEQKKSDKDIFIFVRDFLKSLLG